MIILLLALVFVLLASFLGYVLALKDSESKKEANKVFLWMLLIGLFAVCIGQFSHTYLSGLLEF